MGKHKRYHYLFVIYGWDSVCKQSKNWVRQMGVARLRWKDMQLFYNVLEEDGSYRYAASENSFSAKPQRISGNPQVDIVKKQRGSRSQNLKYKQEQTSSE